MFGLVSRLRVGCFIAAPMGENLVVLDSLIGHEPPDLFVPPGWRMPLRPPFGSVFYAWASADVVEEWLQLIEDSTEEQTERYQRALAAVRARGYSIGGRIEIEAQLDAHLERLAMGEHADRLAAAIQVVDLLREADRATEGTPAPDEDRRQYLIAPIFDRSGRVVMSLTLFGRPSRFGEVEFTRDVQELLAASRRVTAAIGGVEPTPRIDVGELVDEPAATAG
jgi:DNA-binding IclR family transcriptional regulator